MKNLSTVVFVLFLLLVFSCRNTEDDTPVHILKEEFTIEDQSKIGQTIDRYIQANSGSFVALDAASNVSLYSYCDELIETLTTTPLITTRNAYSWKITILKDDNIRTIFSAPGGQLYIYTGFLKFLQAENELMSVLAHEVSYIESGKLMEALATNYVKKPYFLGDIILGNEVAGMDQLCLFLRDISYATDDVMEADEFAMNLICPFQYNAMGLKTVLDSAAISTETILWTTTRPSSADRLEKITTLAEPCGDEEDPTFAERYAFYKNQLP